jgi:hypothetical protein
MALVWIIIATLLVVIAVISLVDLFRNRQGRSGGALFGWAVLIVILPLIGSIIYWSRRDVSQGEIEEGRLAQEDLRREAARRPLGP